MKKNHLLFNYTITEQKALLWLAHRIADYYLFDSEYTKLDILLSKLYTDYPNELKRYIGVIHANKNLQGEAILLLTTPFVIVKDEKHVLNKRLILIRYEQDKAQLLTEKILVRFKV